MCSLCPFEVQFYLFIYFKYLYVSLDLLPVDLVSIFGLELNKAATTGSYKLIKFCKYCWSQLSSCSIFVTKIFFSLAYGYVYISSFSFKNFL